MTTIAFIRENARFLGAGVLLTLNSSFGQTFFISIFAAQIMAVHALSDGEWGLIYTLGTTTSAVVMFWAGALSDRFRARGLAWIVMPGLAVVCLGMALNSSVYGLILLIFLLRFFGQGMMFQLSSVSMARWFRARRGLALSIAGLGVMLGTAAFPPIFSALLEWVNWRYLWVVGAVFVLVSFPIVLWLLTAERTPQSFAEESQSVGMQGRHWSRAEVIGSPFFLLLLPMLLGPPSWGTALFFQQVHIAEIKGWALPNYLALVPLLTGISVVITFVSGQLIDRFGAGRLLQVFMLPWCLGFLILWTADTLAGAAFAFIVFGFAMGLQSTVVTAFWAEYFGTRNIGAIKATSTSIMVFGSAIGPGITGGLIDLGYSFPNQMLAIAIYFALAMIGAWFAVERARLELPAKIDIERA